MFFTDQEASVFNCRRVAPQFRLGRRNPDATDGKLTDATMPRLNRRPGQQKSTQPGPLHQRRQMLLPPNRHQMHPGA